MSPQSSTEASRVAVRSFLTARGEGGTFTLLELREAVPVAQADRRMRELRQATPDPWRIASSQNDRSLPSGVYRIDHIGSARIAPTVSSRVRREVFEEAHNRCQVCGIGVGEEYSEYPGEVARLQLGHWVPMDQGGSPTAKSNMRAECHRCNGGIRNLQGGIVTADSVTARLRALPRASQNSLLQWLNQGRRDVSDGERLYYEISQLPPAARETVVASLTQLVRGGIA